MENRIKQIIKDFIPLIALKIYHNRLSKIRFVGDYPTWDEACKASSGYDTDVILNKVKDALLKVKNGEAVYERDSVLFDKIEYSWPLLAGLMWIAANEDGKLRLIDFGGSLGSSYFQNRFFLKTIKEVEWNIVEQKHFVECGKKHFEDDKLRFYEGIEECLGKQRQPLHAILLSSVIQYIEKPYELIDYILNKKFKYLIFDRTPFLKEGNDRITIQQVPIEIYQASYPAWFLNLEKFIEFLTRKYEIIADFESTDRANIPSYFKGFIYRLKRND